MTEPIKPATDEQIAALKAGVGLRTWRNVEDVSVSMTVDILIARIEALKAEVERLRKWADELEAKPVLLARLSDTASNPVSDSASIAAATYHMSIVEQIEEQGRAILAARKIRGEK